MEEGIEEKKTGKEDDDGTHEGLEWNEGIE